MNWEDAQKYQTDIKEFGLMQAIALYNKYKDIYIPIKDLHWGEEVEYHTVIFNHDEKSAKIPVEGYFKAKEVLEQVPQDQFNFQDEYGSWMIEAVPARPYVLYDVNGPKEALISLTNRRKILNNALMSKDLSVISMPSFVGLGTDG